MGKYHIINCTKNISGAGGFAKGLSQTITYDVDCILFIDDDAMLSPDYMKKLFQARSCYPRYHAYWMKKQVQMFLTGRRAMFWNAGIYGMSICRKIIWLNTLKSKMLMIQKQCSLLAAYLKSNRFVLVKVWQKKAVK